MYDKRICTNDDDEDKLDDADDDGNKAMRMMANRNVAKVSEKA